MRMIHTRRKAEIEIMLTMLRTPEGSYVLQLVDDYDY